MWQHLERLGGGIGTRGPGESQLETDRRLARRRIGQLKRRLRELERRRDTQRKARRRAETPVVALAGYTNAGKSTLLNALTDASVSVDDRLFETLDPTTRGFAHEGRRYLVTDTVGFIRRLPHQLVEGFAATLEETLIVRPRPPRGRRVASDEHLDDTIAAVESVLGEIGGSRASGRARPEQDRRRRPAEAAPPRQPLPGRARRSRRGRARASTSCKAASQHALRSACARFASSSRTTTAASWTSSTSSARRSTSALDRADGVARARALPAA